MEAVDTRRKLHEAIWKQSVSRTHRLWCDCGNFLLHFKTVTCVPTGEDTGEKDEALDAAKSPGISVNFDLGFEDDADEALAAALRSDAKELNKM